MEAALKKFVSRSTLRGEVEQKVDPNRGQKREASPSSQEGARFVSKNYKGRKNPLGKDFKVLKCFICPCDHKESCG